MQKHYGFSGDPGLLARERIGVEHSLGGVKVFRIVHDVYRNHKNICTFFLIFVLTTESALGYIYWVASRTVGNPYWSAERTSGYRSIPELYFLNETDR